MKNYKDIAQDNGNAIAKLRKEIPDVMNAFGTLMQTATKETTVKNRHSAGESVFFNLISKAQTRTEQFFNEEIKAFNKEIEKTAIQRSKVINPPTRDNKAFDHIDTNKQSQPHLPKTPKLKKFTF